MPRQVKKQTTEKEISAKVLGKTFFVPMKRMNDVLDIIEAPPARTEPIRCDYNIMSLKHERSTRDCYDECAERYSSARHISLYVSACYKALYAHDWDRLLYILKRVPKWKIKHMVIFHVKVLTILLMYHPDSQAKGFLNEYIHMVWGCRTTQDKKAIQKVLLTLNKQMCRIGLTYRFWLQIQEQKKKGFLAMDEEKDGEATEMNE